MTDLKRDEIKYIRDYCKSGYKKDTKCYICSTDKDLELHHYYTLTLLWKKWKKENNVVINNAVNIYKYREIFKEDHYKEIYEYVVTLCKYHHKDKLHKIYGKAPTLNTAEKQMRWVNKQKDKVELKNVSN